MSDRFSQCTETCTTDCGHCKGRPVEALRADNERLARRLAGRFEETEKLRNEAAGLRQELDEARAERDRARKDLELNKAGWQAEIDRVLMAEAERDRMRPVIEAAEAWRDNIVRTATVTGAVTVDEIELEAYLESKLMAAVNTFRSATPDAEPAPGVPVDTEATP